MSDENEIIDLDEIVADLISESSEWDLTKALLAASDKGQHERLNGMLKAGVPLHYRDSQGNLVQENPDGTIITIEEANRRLDAISFAQANLELEGETVSPEASDAGKRFAKGESTLEEFSKSIDELPRESEV